MVALRCSIRMEVPLGQTKELVVSPDYIRYLVRIANSKMEANKKRMGGFLDLLQAKGLLGSSKGCATADNESLVAKKSSDTYNCDADNNCDNGFVEISLEASYLESQDPVLQNGAKHGFD